MSKGIILKANKKFDDDVTKGAEEMYKELKKETDHDKYFSICLLQDFTWTTDVDALNIVQIFSYKRKDFDDLGAIDDKSTSVHIIRSMMYSDMAKARVISIFNKIILQA